MEDRGLIDYTEYTRFLQCLKTSGLSKKLEHYREIFIGKLEVGIHIFKTRRQ